MLTKVGSVHNFGRQVIKKEFNGVISFSKPRPIVNELFLFGKNSPLKNIILSSPSNSQQLQAWDAIFSLEGDYSKDVQDWCSNCGEIKNVANLKGNELHQFILKNPKYVEFLTYQFGMIMAYSHFMGITDLTVENIVVSEKGIQIIDAESAFNVVRFVSETHCIGVDNDSKSLSAFLMLLKFTRGYDQNEKLKITDYYLKESYLKSLIEGYIYSIDTLSDLYREIKNVVQNFFNETGDTPFRIILRNSFDYYKNNERDIPFLPEEIVQMNRGDIPYFFSSYNDRKIFYIVDSTGSKKTVDLPKMHPFWIIQRFQVKYESELLFSPDRLQNIRAAGLIEIFRDLKEPKLTSLKIGLTLLEVNDDSIRYAYKNLEYSGYNKPLKGYKDGLELNKSIFQSNTG